MSEGDGAAAAKPEWHLLPIPRIEPIPKPPPKCDASRDDAQELPPPKEEDDTDLLLKNQVRNKYGLKSAKEIEAALESRFKMDAARYTQSGAFSANAYWPERKKSKGYDVRNRTMAEIEKTGRMQTLLTIMDDNTLVRNLDKDFVLTYQIQQYEKKVEKSNEWVNPFAGVHKKKTPRTMRTASAFGNTLRPGHKGTARSPFNVPGMPLQGQDPELMSIAHQGESAVPHEPKSEAHIVFYRGRRGRPHPPTDYTRPPGPQHNYNPRYNMVDKDINTPRLFSSDPHMMNHPNKWNYGRIQHENGETGHPHNYTTDIEKAAIKNKRKHRVENKQTGPLTERFTTYPYKQHPPCSVPIEFQNPNLIGKGIPNTARGAFVNGQMPVPSKLHNIYSRPDVNLAATTPDWTFDYRDRLGDTVRRKHELHQRFRPRSARPSLKKLNKNRLTVAGYRASEENKRLMLKERWQRGRFKVLGHHAKLNDNNNAKSDEFIAKSILPPPPSMVEVIALQRKQHQQHLWLSIITCNQWALKVKSIISNARRKAAEAEQHSVKEVDIEAATISLIAENFSDRCDFFTLHKAVVKISNAFWHHLQRKRIKADKKMGELLVDWFIWARFSSPFITAKNKMIFSAKRIQGFWRRKKLVREARLRWMTQLWEVTWRTRNEEYREQYSNILIQLDSRYVSRVGSIKGSIMPKALKLKYLKRKYKEIQRAYIKCRYLRGIFGRSVDRLDRKVVAVMHKEKTVYWSLKKGLLPMHICKHWYHFSGMEDMHEVIMEAIQYAADAQYEDDNNKLNQ